MFKLFRQYHPTKVVFLFCTETLLIAGSLLASIYIRLYSDPLQIDYILQSPLFRYHALLAVSMGALCMYYNDLYDLTAVCRRSELLIRLIQSAGGWSILLAILSVVFAGLLIGRGILILMVVLSTAGIWVWREISGSLGFLFKARERILILGTGQVGVDLCRKLLARTDLNFEIVGFLDEDSRRIGERLVNPGIIGVISDLGSIVSAQRVNRVIVSLPDRRGRMPVRELLALRLKGVIIEDAHTLYESVAGRISLDMLNPSWLIFSSGFHKIRWQLLVKRCFDLVFGFILLLISMPLMAIIAICIQLDSKGPVLFKQERAGQFGRVFTLMKFRSMKNGAEGNGVPRWAVQNDSRVTKLGRILRDFRLDELPQIFNILRGDMSFVGPRPERPYFVDRLEKKVPYYRERLMVKPGLTGWAQIRFPYASTEEETREKLEYDFFYIKNFSLFFDLAIVFETAKIVLLGRGAR